MSEPEWHPLLEDATTFSPDQLRLWRKHLGLSKTDVADALLLSVAQVHGLESGSFSPFYNQGFYERARGKYVALLTARHAPSRQPRSLKSVEATPALPLTVEDVADRRMTVLCDLPTSLKTLDACMKRRALLSVPHMKPLTEFVASLRLRSGKDMPDFDPLDGGIEAEVLFLLEAPDSRTVTSGFVSRDNPGETARNFLELNRQSGIPREKTVTWHIVPWYLGDGRRSRAARRANIEDGMQSLCELTGLLTRLRIVVLVGKGVQHAAGAVAKMQPHLRIFKTPHPSPRVVNRAPENQAHLGNALRAVAQSLEMHRASSNPSL